MSSFIQCFLFLSILCWHKFVFAAPTPDGPRQIIDQPDSDFRPKRAHVSRQLTKQFIGDYFAHNPISQLGVIVTRNGHAQKLTDLSANQRAHIDVVTASDRSLVPAGDASLQNSLDMACSLLRDIPEYGFREVLVIYGSLATRDPGDIFATIQKLDRHQIRVSVIGLAAEVRVLRKLVETTGGTLGVARNAEHMKQLLRGHSHEPPAYDAERCTLRAEMVEMGFPLREQSAVGSLGYEDMHLAVLESSFVCPRCKTRTSEIPSSCAVCTLPLVSAALLAQSHHHLFPLPLYEESGAERGTRRCFGCGSARACGDKPAALAQYQCPRCRRVFCHSCDALCHGVLFNCPGCLECNSNSE